MIGSADGLFRRLIAFRERYGTAGAFYKSVDVVLHKLFRTSVHAVVWLDLKSLAKMAPPDRRFTFRFLTADEVTAYAKDPAYFLDPALADRVRDGRELCFAALAGDRLAAFGCYVLESNEPEQASGVAMSYPPDVAYMSYGFTHPDFRGARLHGLIMQLVLEELAKRGIQKLVSLVAWTNWASLKSCYRLGYLNLGNMIAVGGRKRAIGIYPKAAKRLGVRFGRKAVKRL
jgi:GNAT superfamily N-acetyltransferase